MLLTGNGIKWLKVGRCGAKLRLGRGSSPPVNKMTANGPGAPTYYNSLYRHGVDEKRRVQIPAMWRPSEPGIEFTLILWPKAKEGPCLRVLPPQEMAELMRDIDAMPNSDPNKVVLKRFI